MESRGERIEIEMSIWTQFSEKNRCTLECLTLWSRSPGFFFSAQSAPEILARKRNFLARCGKNSDWGQAQYFKRPALTQRLLPRKLLKKHYITLHNTPSKRSLSSRSGSNKKRKIDVRLELQKVAQENEDEKEAEDPHTPGGPLKK